MHTQRTNFWIWSALFVWLGTQSAAAAQQAASPTSSELPPAIVLNHTKGNFFVLASDFPFAVSKASSRVGWFDVESVSELETLPRTVELTPRPARLRSGIYFGAVRIDFRSAAGDDYVLIPVILRVGEQYEDRFGIEESLLERIPSRLVRIEAKDPEVAVEVKATPGGHFIVEILNESRRREELGAMAARAADVLAPTAASQTYPVVFPWMCLETPCGRKTSDDIADVEPNLDAVNALSYERYSMSGGTWKILSGVGDPGDWAKQQGLKLWPMVVGGYQPSEADVNAMWAGRETIAQNMIAAAESRDYEGYCIDVEGHAKGNSKNTFINLVTYLANRLHDNDIKLMVAHATWSNIAPIADLAASPVDYVATMDPYTSAWQTYIPNDYAAIDGSRLVWAFTWDRIASSTQSTMWSWMESGGYNQGVAGAAAWRTPLMNAPNGLNYYDGFRRYYPADDGASDCLASVPAERWKGEYFDNTNLGGSPVLVRDEGGGSLNLNWGAGGPDATCGVGSDLFSARFTRTVNFSAGRYRFKVFVDDGVRLWVGSTLLIDEWKVQVASYEAEITLPSGPQTIRMEYYENLGGAAAQLSWEKLSGSTCQQSVASGRWKGEYFATMDLSGAPVMTRDDGDGALDFDWGGGSPSTSCGVPADRFSVRFSRTASFSAGTHRFTVTSDDGFRLYVDGALKLEKWFDQAPTTYTVDVSLSAGNHALRLDYYENGGGATAKLSWKAVSAGPVVVDDGDPGFELLETSTGKPEWWHKESGLGYGNDMVWTQNTYSRKDNYARWKPSLAAAGNYKVEAHIPSNHATTQQARYVIVADGATHTKTVNQNIYYDQWVDLGTYRFRADGSDYVELADVTGETSISREVGFDAMRFTFTTDSPPPPSGQWAYPVGSADSGAGWRVTLGLGQSWTSSSGKAYNGHLGEDWARSGATSLGQPVYAAAAGEVVTVLQNCGNYVDVVIIKHQVAGIAEPMYTFYGHIEADGYVSVGDRVSRRQQIGVIGDPVTFGPHLHFEVKNETALVNPPFSTCSNTSNGVYISAGYSGKRNDYSGGDYWDPSNDGVSGNHYYHPTRFIQNRLATTSTLQSVSRSAVSRALAPPSILAAVDGLPRCEDLP